MRYEVRVKEVDAFQMTDERFKSNIDWPDWLHEAWNREENEINSFSCEKINDSIFYMLNTNYGKVLVRRDDWIIRTDDDNLDVLRFFEFKRVYKRIKND